MLTPECLLQAVRSESGGSPESSSPHSSCMLLWHAPSCPHPTSTIMSPHLVGRSFALSFKLFYHSGHHGDHDGNHYGRQAETQGS